MHGMPTDDHVSDARASRQERGWPRIEGMNPKLAFPMPAGAGSALAGLGQRFQQLSPTARHAIIGGGIGGLGSLLLGGEDKHPLQAAALGAGLGALHGHYRGGGAPQPALPEQLPLKLSSAHEAGKRAALAKFGLQAA